MSQLELFNIPSPCVGVCEVNSKGYCKGCFRSRDERLHWLQLTDERKRDVLRLCLLRKARVQKAREDTQARPDDPDLIDQRGLF